MPRCSTCSRRQGGGGHDSLKQWSKRPDSSAAGLLAFASGPFNSGREDDDGVKRLETLSTLFLI